MFWDKYKLLCDKVRMSPTAVAKELGFSNATPSHWKSGADPSRKTMQIIADYFGVPIESLYDDTALPAEAIMPGESAEKAQAPATTDDPIIEDVLVYARAMIQTDNGRKKLADITKFMRQSVELEDLGRKIFNG